MAESHPTPAPADRYPEAEAEANWHTRESDHVLLRWSFGASWVCEECGETYPTKEASRVR